MTNIDQFFRKECNKIDARCVNAYLELKLDSEDPINLILDSSWGETSVDLTDAIKAGETNTHLFLSPDCGDKTSLQYNPERGGPDCIPGDELSRIISMQLLKDVDQTVAPAEGDIYYYHNGRFQTFNIIEALAEAASASSDVLQNILNRLTAIEHTLTRPVGVPSDTKVTWGNINLISDNTNSDVRTSGFYTHSIDASADIPNDEYFS